MTNEYLGEIRPRVLIVFGKDIGVFKDRFEAGLLLGQQLAKFSFPIDLIIGLARGGVAVAAQVAKVMGKPFDVLVVKKIGSPGNPELAIGARVPEGQRLDIRDKTIIITDDGAATGATMDAAIHWAREHKTKKIIVALPVAPPETVAKLRTLVGDVVVLEAPLDFSAVGQFYRNFSQVTDEEVVQLLE